MIVTPVAVDLIQGSDEWLAWRETGIGSSDVAAIMGCSPWTTIDELWRQKLGISERPPQTAAMRKGSELEPLARFLFEWERGKSYPPQCFTTLEYDFIKVSLDGWNRPEIWEGKIPGKTSHQKHLRKGCPDYYQCQCQYQMLGSGGEIAYFTSLNDDFPEGQQFIVWPVKRDDAYIEKMLQKVLAFWNCLERGIEPTTGMLEQSVNGLYAATF